MTIKRIEIDVLLDDDSEHRITVSNPSLVAWDRQRAMRKWPSAAEAPQVWTTFLAWHQMKAQGLISCELTEFEEARCLAAYMVSDDEADEVDPTQPTPEVGSASS